MADSWKMDGNCDECMRKRYCKQSCKAYQRKIRQDLLSIIMNQPRTKALDEAMNGHLGNFLRQNYK